MIVAAAGFGATDSLGSFIDAGIGLAGPPFVSIGPAAPETEGFAIACPAEFVIDAGCCPEPS